MRRLLQIDWLGCLALASGMLVVAGAPNLWLRFVLGLFIAFTLVRHRPQTEPLAAPPRPAIPPRPNYQPTPAWITGVTTLTDMLAAGRRRAIAYGERADKVTAAEVREHWTQLRAFDCHLCRKPFSESAPMSLDHVIPLSRGGTHMLDNFLPSHRWCNTQKGNRPAERYRRTS